MATKKKVTKKKKVSKKKAIKKIVKKRKYPLVNAPEENLFWVCDGRVLRNIKDLAIALQEMSEETYRFHANETKNDFSNWVKDILKDSRLAASLKKAKSRKDALKKIKNKLRNIK